MKVTIKLKSTEQLRPLINFIQDLTGKDFKEIKVKKTDGSKMELSEHPKTTPNYNGKYNNIDELMVVLAEGVGYTNYDRIKKIINKDEEEKIKNMDIKYENFLKLTNLEDKKKIDEILKSLYKDYKKKINSEGLKCRICNKEDIFGNNETNEYLSQILSKSSDPKQNKVYYGSESV